MKKKSIGIEIGSYFIFGGVKYSPVFELPLIQVNYNQIFFQKSKFIFNFQIGGGLAGTYFLGEGEFITPSYKFLLNFGVLNKKYCLNYGIGINSIRFVVSPQLLGNFEIQRHLWKNKFISLSFNPLISRFYNGKLTKSFMRNFFINAAFYIKF